MELLLVLVIAAATGYFVGASKWGKKVDDATVKMTDSTRDAADNMEGWFRTRFGKKTNVVDVESKDAETQDVKAPAEKSVSRRKSEDTETV